MLLVDLDAVNWAALWMAAVGSKIKRKDIYYMQIVEEQQRALLILQDVDGKLVHSWRPEYGWTCSSREISTRIGRCVVLNDRFQTTIAMLLPVSLENCFFSGGELVSSKQFSLLHGHLFANGSGKVYAPDEQHDAAMYVMFSLDSIIKEARA